MNTDIKFDEDIIKLEAFRIEAHSADFYLDWLARRPGTNPSEPRRALVHDDNDLLRLNYAGDYKGGVYIHGKVNLEGATTIQSAAVVQGTLDVSGNTQFNNDVAVLGALEVHDTLKMHISNPATGFHSTMDVGAEISKMRKEIQLLKEQVAELKRK